MIIDAHSHVHDPVTRHIALLDEAGVDRAVLFGTRPHPERATTLAELRHEMGVLTTSVSGQASPDSYATARRELQAALDAYPDRFIGFGSVPLGPRVEEDVELLVEAGFRGIGELTPPPDQAGLVEPVLRAAADHGGLPVVVHGFAPTTKTDLETLAGLARQYPTVPLVISQLGGLNWLTAIELVRDNLSMYLELSTANVIFAVRLAITEIPDRTIYGSDAPYGDPFLARATVERVTEPGELRDRVLGGTFAELLKL
ncbi:amidohydrolase family protein [Kibdelosporangium lantanae]